MNVRFGCFFQQHYTDIFRGLTWWSCWRGTCMANPELPRTNGMCFVTQPSWWLFEPFHLVFLWQQTSVITKLMLSNLTIRQRYHIWCKTKTVYEFPWWFSTPRPDEGVTTTSKSLLRLFQRLPRQGLAVNTTVVYNPLYSSIECYSSTRRILHSEAISWRRFAMVGDFLKFHSKNWEVGCSITHLAWAAKKARKSLETFR